MKTVYDFFVIGIGSSAGGLEPLKTIVKDLPPNINAALIVVQHFPADKESHLPSILRRLTPLHVVSVETIEYLEPGHIYVMAAGKEIKLKDRMVFVEDRTVNDRINHTIDHCFESLATEVKDKSIGVILSGAGYDGLAGAKAIEQQNGLVIVQDPATAQFPLMPETLIANDHPDYILQPADINRKIKEKVAA
jgi:two-component system, chemotaxis family, protein-glutamate methylesterase/glutaminase